MVITLYFNKSLQTLLVEVLGVKVGLVALVTRSLMKFIRPHVVTLNAKSGNNDQTKQSPGDTGRQCEQCGDKSSED